MYTYGFDALDDNFNNSKGKPSCSGVMLHSIHGSGSSRNPRQKSRKDSRRQQSRTDSTSFYNKASVTANKVKLLQVLNLRLS